MDKPTHYIEARILALDGIEPSRADIAFATTSIMSCVHLAIVEGSQLAVAFPNMDRKTKTLTTGNVVRVFGSILDLAKLLGRSDFASLNAGGMFRLGKDAIKEVPMSTAWVIYSRTRKVERTFPGFEVRENRRKSKLGLSAHPPRAEHEPPKDVPYVRMRSVSTGGHSFSVFINQETANGFEVGVPNTYGLGVTVPAF